MGLEVLAALGVALLVFWLVFEPFRDPAGPDLSGLEPAAPEETRRGQALLALKEIEFDKETGKLSEADYELLKAKYGAAALAALADPGGPEEGAGIGDPEALVAAQVRTLRSARTTGQPMPAACSTCGPRPEADALFCSSCGLPLSQADYCSQCGSRLPPDSRFCSACGRRVAA